MKQMRNLSGRELRWVQPRAFRCSYELRDGEEVVATLQSAQNSSSAVVFESADGRWTFRRAGFWVPQTIVFDSSERAIARFHPNFWYPGGTLDIEGAGTLKAKSNFSMSRLDFRDGDVEPVIRCERFRGIFHRGSITRIAPPAAGRGELPWLVGLAWHLALKMQDEAGAAAGAAAAVAASG